jgi:hypothetical protein
VPSLRACGFAATAAASILGTALACDEGSGTECACTPQGFTVTIETGATAQTTQLVPSGPACTMATVTCTSDDGGPECTAYRVIPTASGTCVIDVYFGGGTADEQDVNIVHDTGCCSGFYPDPPSAGDVDFPAPGAPGDAGPGEGGGADA